MNGRQVASPIVLSLAALILISGCGLADPTPNSTPGVRPGEVDEPTKLHPAETAAHEFVTIFSRDELPGPAREIARLRKLDDRAREEALQSLAKHLRPRRWTLWFTALVVLEGREDVATCFFQGDDGEHLVVMLATLQDGWVVTAFETPATPWARSKGESLEQYVHQTVAGMKQQGKSFQDGPLADGLYLLEHSSIGPARMDGRDAPAPP